MRSVSVSEHIQKVQSPINFGYGLQGTTARSGKGPEVTHAEAREPVRTSTSDADRIPNVCGVDPALTSTGGARLQVTSPQLETRTSPPESKVGFFARACGKEGGVSSDRCIGHRIKWTIHQHIFLWIMVERTSEGRGYSKRVKEA